MRFFNNVILEQNVITRPFFHMDEIETIHEDTLKNMDTELNVPSDVLDSFNIKDELCPAIWENDKLKPEVQKKLMRIALDFFNSLELEGTKIHDVLLVGSLGNYNWSKFSDVDLHIVVDFNEFAESPDIIKKYFDAQKNHFNANHNIIIKHFPVEIYVQDKHEKLDAAAIYSVAQNKWKSKPEKTNFKLDKTLVKRKVENIFDIIKHIKKDYNNKKYDNTVKNIEKLKEQIKKMRKSGLEKGGEYSIENIVFKILRRTDVLEILDTLKNNAYDKTVSLNEKK